MKLAIVLAVCVAAPCMGQQLQPEPPIQEQLGKVVTALGKYHGPMHLNAAAIQELADLTESVSDKREIIKQIAVLASGPGEQQPLVALALMDLLELPPGMVIPVLAPHLDADDAKLRSFVRDWFQSHDNGGDNDPLKPVNFEDYVKYVRGQQGNVPAPFVDYVYERSPGRALIVFYRASRRQDAVDALQAEARNVEAARREAGIQAPPVNPKEFDEILVTEQLVRHALSLRKWENGKLLPEAKEELAKLGSNEEWWVRRYVAEIMRRHPELQLNDVLQKLKEDANPLVSKAASVER